ncbi:CPBP family intramembrane glutamic endopeptidase [Halolamina salifodinae]|uniref:Membrane protease YdiL (CAAX protease family) n=1 Tax=Halolamina salifodinae TaxID=1202767 RepID=A0A8T4GW05_9EURY|nr:CPBP family intramembrane glutamic endopeptidase [Halolamina salifodinae]MBP1986302.1 membrane protease YdiL (CAAX protease family) [Halolamina salifodinae]
MSQSSRPTRPISGPRLLRTVQAFVLFVAGVVGGSVGVSLWAGAAPALGVAEGTTAYEIANTVAQFVGIAAPVALFVAAAGDRDLLSFEIPDRRGAAIAVGAAVALYVLQIVLLALFSLVDVAPSQNPAVDPTGREATYFLLMIPASVLVVGPAEELLVRGGIQGLLKRAWGPWPGIIGASALFGSLHYIGSGSGALAYVAFSFLLGCLLGYLYERTGNLVVPMVAHGGYNAAIYAIQYATI